MRGEEVVRGLAEDDEGTRLSSIRALQTSAIGSPAKKSIFLRLGAAPLYALLEREFRTLLSIVSQGKNEEIIVNAIDAIGTLARGSEVNLALVRQCGAVVPLTNAIKSSSLRVVEAAARALHVLVISAECNKDPLFEDKAVLPLLVSLLTNPNAKIVEVAARLLGICSDSNERQAAIAACGALEKLFQNLHLSSALAREACLWGLCQLTSGNRALCWALISQPGALERCSSLLRDKRANARLLSATLMSNLVACGLATGANDAGYQVAQQALLVAMALLQDLEPASAPHLPPVIVSFFSNANVRRSGLSSQALRKLTDSLARFTLPIAQESTLNALGSLCKDDEECRRQVLATPSLNLVILALSSSTETLRIAACRLLRSLSRASKYARAMLIQSGPVTPLVKLLSDENEGIQLLTLSTLSNVALDSLPVKQAILAQGFIRVLELSRSMDPDLRVAALRLLSNLAYSAPLSYKSALSKLLPWPLLFSFVQDHEPSAQLTGLVLLRNILANNAEALSEPALIDELFNLLDNKLGGGADTSPPEATEEVLYILCNVCDGDGGSACRVALMGSKLHLYLIKFLDHALASLRLACCRCLLNLTWKDFEGAAERLGQLKVDGCDLEKVNKLAFEDVNLHVRDHAIALLPRFVELME